MMIEEDRLNFLIKRDGLEGALDFAKRTMVSYRRYVLDKRRCVREFRTTFIRSYLDFKHFIARHED